MAMLLTSTRHGLGEFILLLTISVPTERYLIYLMDLINSIAIFNLIELCRINNRTLYHYTPLVLTYLLTY